MELLPDCEGVAAADGDRDSQGDAVDAGPEFVRMDASALENLEVLRGFLHLRSLRCRCSCWPSIKWYPGTTCVLYPWPDTDAHVRELGEGGMDYFNSQPPQWCMRAGRQFV